MTWSLQVSGHGADPDEERAVLESCRELIEILSKIAQTLGTATFIGSYHNVDLLAKDEG